LRIGAQPPRWLLISPLAAASAAQPAGAPPHCEPAPPEAWQRLSVAAGEPEVFAATSEEFVAQMLNLDVLGAIAFDKGCYTGEDCAAGRPQPQAERARVIDAQQLALPYGLPP